MMQVWVNENNDKLIELIELEEIKSKQDPCEQPYRSQYAARTILQECISDLDDQLKKGTIPHDYVSDFVYFSLSYRLANNFITTEERQSGEDIIQKMCDKIEQLPSIKDFIDSLPDKVSPIGDFKQMHAIENKVDVLNEKGESVDAIELIYISQMAGLLMKVYNMLGMLWASRITIMDENDLFSDVGVQKSVKYLGRAKCLYKKYKLLMKTKHEIDVKSKVDYDLNYEGPNCFDSFLLQEIDYGTPHLYNECNCTVTMEEINELNIDMFESDFTTTLFLLAQTYGKMSSKNFFKRKAARYCYWTLGRQLNALKYDPVEWSLNAATLSQYFITEKAFKRARHCIAAAQIVMKEAMTRPTNGPDNNKASDATDNTQSDDKLEADDMADNASGESNKEADDDDMGSKAVDNIFNDAIDQIVGDMKSNTNLNDNDKDNNANPDSWPEDPDQVVKGSKKQLKPDPMSESRLWDDDVYEEKRIQGEADIARCWIHYGNTLLEVSSERMLPTYDFKAEKELDLIERGLDDFNLEVDSIEKQITNNYVVHFDDARDIFLFVQRKINSAKEYYKMDFRCSDYAELVFDYSKAFKCLGHFEPTTERKCCMMKRRVDMLMELLDQLNIDYYTIACRKMMLEIGEIFCSMMAMKMSNMDIHTNDTEGIKINAANPKTKGQIAKNHKLAKQGINIYERFFETYRNKQGIFPTLFANEDIRPLMIGHFYLARIHSKIIELDPKVRVENLRNSLYHYKYIVDYCEKHDEAAQAMAPELESCKDMVFLLPCKIDKIIASMN